MKSLNFSFFKNLSRYLLVGFSIFTLLFVAQSQTFQTIPVLANQDTPFGLSATCSGGTAQFNWQQAIKDNGEPASNYTLRVNKEPFDQWAPDDGVSGDRTFQVGSGMNYSTALPAGNYGFSVQAGYSSDNGTTSTQDGPTFNCAGSSGGSSTYSMCGKSGTVWDTAHGGTYQPLTDCAAGQYLVVDEGNGYLLPSCRAIPAGNVRGADVCSITQVAAVNPPSGGVVSCTAGGAATFNWSAASKTGQNVANYTVRVNKDPGADWSPNSGSGDEAWEAGNSLNATRQLTVGNYPDWTVQAGFTDDTTSEAIHFGAFSCAVAAGGPAPAGSVSRLEGGNFMTAFNNSTQQGTWADPISAAPSDVVEFRVRAYNSGNAPATNVQMWGSVTGQVPQDPAMQLVITGKINDPSAGSSLTDTAVVNITGGVPVGMRYYPGHARINGVTSVYNCPNTCNIPDDGVLGGLNVGTIQPNDFVELTFKASLSALGSAPACVSNGSCSVQAPSACGQTNTGVDNCGNVCTRPSAACTAGQGGPITITNNPTITNTFNPTNTIINNVGVGTTVRHTGVAGVTQLPKTGLPALAWAAFAFIPAGFNLRRFSKVKRELEDHPSFIAEDRHFKLG